MKILLVDDEPQYRMLVRDILEGEGWTVFTAGNGEEALAIIAEASIDIVVSDVYMPVMDGIKFHRSVRASATGSKIPFLFVSAYDDEYTLSAVNSSKLDGFLKKGRPPQELVAWVKYLSTPPHLRPLMPPTHRSKPDHSPRKIENRPSPRSR